MFDLRQRRNRRRHGGFTLIELMIVVAVIGILAAISLPMFANLVAKSEEATTKGNLGTLKSALAIYYGDNEGFYPQFVAWGTPTLEITLLPGGRYLQSLPNAYLPKTPNSRGHPTANVVVQYEYYGAGDLSHQTIDAWETIVEGIGLSGGWMYDDGGPVMEFPSPTWGKVLVNCNHRDIKGDAWDTY